MADINQIITLGVGTPADIPHFILVGLSPNDSVIPISGDGTLTLGPPVLLGVGMVAYGGGRFDAGLVHHAPTAPVVSRDVPRATPTPIDAYGEWGRPAPRVHGRGRLVAPVRASGKLHRPATAWRPAAGTVDLDAAREEEAFLLAIVSRMLLDDD